MQGRLGERRIPSFEWSQSEDKGIDLIAFVSEGESATSFVFGVQVKSGPSYFRGEEGSVPVENHREYWFTSTLPVYVTAVKDKLLRIEDAYSALLNPDKGMSGKRIRCVADFTEVAQHIRMRARVHALAPSLSQGLRLPLLSEVIHLSPFGELCRVFCDTSDNLEWETLLSLFQVVRWSRRDEVDFEDIKQFCEQGVNADNITVVIADACMQWLIIFGAEVESSDKTAPNFIKDREQVYAQVDSLFELLKLFLSPETAIDSRVERARVIARIMSKNDFHVGQLPGSTGYFPATILGLIAGSSRDSIDHALADVRGQIISEVRMHISDLVRAFASGAPAHGELNKRLSAMVAPSRFAAMTDDELN